jgi:hypothetical protein
MLFYRLHFSFQLIEIGFQFYDLFSLRPVMPLKVSSVSTAFTTATAIAATAASLIGLAITLLTHYNSPLLWE